MVREITLKPAGAEIDQVYRFSWKNNARRKQLFGRFCVVQAGEVSGQRRTGDDE